MIIVTGMIKTKTFFELIEESYLQTLSSFKSKTVLGKSDQLNNNSLVSFAPSVSVKQLFDAFIAL